ALGLPAVGALTRIGYDRRPGEPLRFEGETRVKFRLEQRTWYFKLKKQAKGREADTKEEPPEKYESSRLRLEIVIRAKEPLQPGHQVVVCQMPYANGWVQAIPLKRYSKKKDDREQLKENPPTFDDMKCMEKQLEDAYPIDLWETGSNYVAGVS